MTQGVKASYEAGCVPIEHSAWPVAQGRAQFPALEHDIDTAFLVIGAGLAGASLALHLAHALADDRPQDLVLPVIEPIPAARPQGLEFSIRRIMIPAARMIDRFGPAWLKA